MIVLESDEDLGLGWIMHKYTVVTTRYTAPPFVIRVRGRVDSSLSFMAEVVLPKSGSVRFRTYFSEPRTGLRFWFSDFGEPEPEPNRTGL